MTVHRRALKLDVLLEIPSASMELLCVFRWRGRRPAGRRARLIGVHSHNQEVRFSIAAHDKYSIAQSLSIFCPRETTTGSRDASQIYALDRLSLSGPSSRSSRVVPTEVHIYRRVHPAVKATLCDDDKFDNCLTFLPTPWVWGKTSINSSVFSQRSWVLSHVRLIGNLLDLSTPLPVVTRAEKLRVPVDGA